VIRGAHLARSIIEKNVGGVKIAFQKNVLICGLEKGIEAVRFL
jgi:hypothetical protein